MTRIMLGAGGTGGHVYPALAVAEALSESDAHELYFVGTVGGMERRLVEISGVSFQRIDEVRAGPIVGVNPARALFSLIKMGIGVLQSLMILMQVRPDVILFTGGWANVPVAVVAKILGRPMIVYLPDIAPGRTVKMLATLAGQAAITVDDAAAYFPGIETIVTGYPLRNSFDDASRDAGIAHFGLNPAKKTLLITGGSSGARNINQAIERILPQLLMQDLQILHISGTLDYERVKASTADISNPDYHLLAYVDAMALAYAVSDIALCRAGASTLAELPFFGLPGILVPYPYAWDYQKINADYLAERGAAIHMNDEDMAEQLLLTLEDLLQHPTKLADMAKQAHAIRQQPGAAALAEVLLELAGETHS
ncbi:MAG: UDP-N-acetylglucosamine--N-acetylmuramyl-(pentapeptide) pyrophosphoryl-undecaprenol N-acetylglucosamine transferase [Aggregatilineales bacterium]